MPWVFGGLPSRTEFDQSDLSREVTLTSHTFCWVFPLTLSPEDRQMYSFASGRKGASLSLPFVIGVRFFSAVVKRTRILANSSVLFLLVNCRVHYRFSQNNACLLYLLSCLDDSLGVIAISTLQFWFQAASCLEGG